MSLIEFSRTWLSVFLSVASVTARLCYRGTCLIYCRDEFTVKILHSSFCDPKIELRSSWCYLCSSFFGVFWRKNNVELHDTFPAQPVQGIKYFEEKEDSPSAAAMKWSDVKHSCNPLRKHSSLIAPQITISFFKVLL